MTSIYRSPKIIVATLTLCWSAGCGLFGDLPAYRGTQMQADGGHPDSDDGADSDGDTGSDGGDKCSVAADCPTRPHMTAICDAQACDYMCQSGYADLDESAADNGCECEIQPEVCDGQDNDCDGVSDNLFEDGQIAVGQSHTCATTADGQIYCWGQNDHGQLGSDIADGSPTPELIGDSSRIEANSIDLGANHSCALAGEDLYCWGQNDTGQLGLGSDQEDHSAAVHVEFPGAPTTITAGSDHTCALGDESAVYCWGNNAHLQVGDDTGAPIVPEPQGVSDDLSFKAISAGQNHSCGLIENGTAYCWGANDAGQLGVASPESSEPVAVGTRVFSSISAGDQATCARTPTDKVSCWGGQFGQPGLLTKDGELVELRTISTAGASGQICGMLDTDTATCRQADGSWEQFDNFNFVAIAAGTDHICAIADNGLAYCWGNNSAGQLGNGSLGGSAATPQLASCR